VAGSAGVAMSRFSGTLPEVAAVFQKEFPATAAARAFELNNPDFSAKSALLQNGHWEFPEQMGVDKHIGFIYAMYDTVLNRAYIGKKFFVGMGKLNRGKESNWRKYVSSSNLLAELLKVRPAEEFEFICIEQYKTKGCLAYAETWSLCYVEAPTSPVFYNTRIEGISWSVKERISDRHKERLETILKRTKK